MCGGVETSSDKTMRDKEERLTAAEVAAGHRAVPFLTFESGTLQQVERVPQQGPVAHGQQRLGDAGRQVRHAGAAARRHQHGLELHPATAPRGASRPARAQPGPTGPNPAPGPPAPAVRHRQHRCVALSHVTSR